MEKIITHDNLRSFAYVNNHICKKPIRGIVIFFYGLNWNKMLNEDPPEAIRYAQEGILYVVPYNRPWAWMNRQAATYTDEILDVLFAACGLSPDTPIVASGMSMGGMSAILYSKASRRMPVACVANCPVCDMVYHLTERPDLPRTLYGAYYGEEGTLEQVLAKHSPLHLVEELPKISYHIFHCRQDLSVNIRRHSERFVEAMKKEGHSITLVTVPDRGHCDLTEEARAQFERCCIQAIKPETTQ